jgi:pimeloyl-ACP methyl ester carboxylesterase
MDLLASYFNAHVIAIDYRGFADSGVGEMPSEEGTQLDAQAVLEWVKKRVPSLASSSSSSSSASQAKKPHLYLYGSSLGCGVALQLAADGTSCGAHVVGGSGGGGGQQGGDSNGCSEFNGLIMDAPFSSVRAAAQSHPLANMFRIVPFLIDYLFGAFDIHYHNERVIPLVGANILLLHGSADNKISFDNSRRNFLSATAGCASYAIGEQGVCFSDSDDNDTDNDSSSNSHSNSNSNKWGLDGAWESSWDALYSQDAFQSVRRVDGRVAVWDNGDGRVRLVEVEGAGHINIYLHQDWYYELNQFFERSEPKPHSASGGNVNDLSMDLSLDEYECECDCLEFQQDASSTGTGTDTGSGSGTDSALSTITWRGFAPSEWMSYFYQGLVCMNYWLFSSDIVPDVCKTVAVAAADV